MAAPTLQRLWEAGDTLVAVVSLSSKGIQKGDRAGFLYMDSLLPTVVHCRLCKTGECFSSPMILWGMLLPWSIKDLEKDRISMKDGHGLLRILDSIVLLPQIPNLRRKIL